MEKAQKIFSRTLFSWNLFNKRTLLVAFSLSFSLSFPRINNRLFWAGKSSTRLKKKKKTEPGPPRGFSLKNSRAIDFLFYEVIIYPRNEFRVLDAILLLTRERESREEPSRGYGTRNQFICIYMCVSLIYVKTFTTSSLKMNARRRETLCSEIALFLGDVGVGALPSRRRARDGRERRFEKKTTRFLRQTGVSPRPVAAFQNEHLVEPFVL